MTNETKPPAPRAGQSSPLPCCRRCCAGEVVEASLAVVQKERDEAHRIRDEYRASHDKAMAMFAEAQKDRDEAIGEVNRLRNELIPRLRSDCARELENHIAWKASAMQELLEAGK